VGVKVGVKRVNQLNYLKKNQVLGEELGEPGRNRTFNQQIKSLLLCQLSYGPT
jgi:hypothetical protein